MSMLHSPFRVPSDSMLARSVGVVPLSSARPPSFLRGLGLVAVVLWALICSNRLLTKVFGHTREPIRSTGVYHNWLIYRWSNLS